MLLKYIYITYILHKCTYIVVRYNHCISLLLLYHITAMYTCELGFTILYRVYNI